ncbi:mcfF [Symbiodinium natans]|uniref:McfF protein n=1 Tax=Symbiodinium natans TaxID=878477 RepID=A0A812N600_9DINO|nr:mcfF [Symbiodinium natans]
MSRAPAAPCRMLQTCACGGVHSGGPACACPSTVGASSALSSPASGPAPTPGDPERPGDSSDDILDRFEQWEEWDASTPLWKHAAAGSCAGVMEHIGMYPLDTVKTHMQALRPGGTRTLSSVVQSIVAESGGYGFMRGASSIVIGCVPAHIALFTSYEYVKGRILSDDNGHEPARAALCGASATLCHDAILTPMDVVKQRMQLGCYRNVGLSLIQRVWEKVV